MKPEKNNLVEELLYKEEQEGEKRINKIVLLICFVFIIIVIIDSIITRFNGTAITNILFLAGLFIYTIIIYVLLKKDIYRPFYKWVSTTLYITFPSLLLISYSSTEGWIHTVRSSVSVCYLLSIILSGYYKRPGVTIYAGFLASFEYTCLFLYVVLFTNVKVINQESYKVHAVCYSQQIFLSSIMIMAGFFVAGITKRLKILLSRTISSEAESQQLEMDKRKAEEINRIKTNLFINIAHETKTPLTLISNYIDKYIKKAGFDPEIKIIKQNIDKLRRDMVNYLDAEKLEKGSVFYNHDQIINMSEMIESKIILIQEIAAKKNIKIKKKIEHDVFIKADPFAIDRVINNLADNAIKYTPENEEIEITLKIKHEKINLIVKDTGVGISDDQQQHIFQPYYQISHKKRNIQGIGMGLFITKKIIDSLDGNIEVKSQLEKGAAFIVSLNRYVLKENDSVKDDSKYSSIIDSVPVIQKIDATEIRPGYYNVLIVEDNIDLLAYLHTNMSEKYNTFTAVNGRDAMEKLKDIPKPNVIISDIMMDIMDGYDFYNEISNNETYKDIPFIFLTARTSLNEKIKGLSDGAIDYICKPFSIDELFAKVASIIRNRNIITALYEKDKYAAVGMLMAGISHEIFNPLSGISGPIQVIKKRIENSTLNSDEKIQKYINTIIENINRITGIVSNMKMLLHNKDIEKIEIDIENIVKTVTETLELNKHIKDRIDIRCYIETDIRLIANQTAFIQILLNIISNSIDSISEKGEIIIEIKNDSGKSIIKISDTGCGIKKENINKIYNPYYTEKDIGKGCGLGLYIVKDLILKMGWDIDVKSIEGKGSEFIITTC